MFLFYVMLCNLLNKSSFSYVLKYMLKINMSMITSFGSDTSHTTDYILKIAPAHTYTSIFWQSFGISKPKILKIQKIGG